MNDSSSFQSRDESDPELARLEDRLDEVVLEFRKCIQAYRLVYEQLLQTGRWNGIPDFDSCLPDNLMPDKYGEIVGINQGASYSPPQIAHHPTPTTPAQFILDAEDRAGASIRLRSPVEAYQEDLAEVIAAVNVGLERSPRTKAERIKIASNNIAKLAIFLFQSTEGRGTKYFISEVIERLLLLYFLRLPFSDAHVDELAAVLANSGVTVDDVADWISKNVRDIANSPTTRRVPRRS